MNKSKISIRYVTTQQLVIKQRARRSVSKCVKYSLVSFPVLPSRMHTRHPHTTLRQPLAVENRPESHPASCPPEHKSTNNGRHKEIGRYIYSGIYPNDRPNVSPESAFTASFRLSKTSANDSKTSRDRVLRRDMINLCRKFMEPGS